MTVTFFGHRDVPDMIEKTLAKTVEDMILVERADTFYVGNHGNFDRIVTTVLKKAQQKYPYIKCYTVLSGMPTTQQRQFTLETLLPTEVVQSHYKAKINKRNLWMIAKSDTIVTYVCTSFGGAAKFRSIAIRQGKRVIDLYHGEEK